MTFEVFRTSIFIETPFAIAPESVVDIRQGISGHAYRWFFKYGEVLEVDLARVADRAIPGSIDGL